MVSTRIYLIALVAVATALLVQVSAETFLKRPSLTFGGRETERKFDQSFSIRGGSAIDVDDSEDELDIESSDEEEIDLDAKLTKSAVSAATKAKSKAKSATKKAVSSTLKQSAPKPSKKKSGILSLFRIPYILKATLNPFVFWQMTKGYWASLFNLNYLNDKVDTSQDLRNALEAKAKKSGSSGSKGKRKFKPGQAKTLSDLPQLNT